MPAWLICEPLLTFGGCRRVSCPEIYWLGRSLKCIHWHLFILSWPSSLVWQRQLFLHLHHVYEGKHKLSPSGNKIERSLSLSAGPKDQKTSFWMKWFEFYSLMIISERHTVKPSHLAARRSYNLIVRPFCVEYPLCQCCFCFITCETKVGKPIICS